MRAQRRKSSQPDRQHHDKKSVGKLSHRTIPPCKSGAFFVFCADSGFSARCEVQSTGPRRHACVSARQIGDFECCSGSMNQSEPRFHFISRRAHHRHG
jgi:hypothetical protein